MRLLRLAIEEQRWDLAAHTIVLATANLLNNRPRRSKQRGAGKTYVTRSKEKNRRSKEQPEG